MCGCACVCVCVRCVLALSLSASCCSGGSSCGLIRSRFFLSSTQPLPSVHFAIARARRAVSELGWRDQREFGRRIEALLGAHSNSWCHTSCCWHRSHSLLGSQRSVRGCWAAARARVCTGLNRLGRTVGEGAPTHPPTHIHSPTHPLLRRRFSQISIPHQCVHRPIVSYCLFANPRHVVVRTHTQMTQPSSHVVVSSQHS